MDQKTQDAIRTIHKGNHIIFKEIGRVCGKLGIRYFIDSGNLLGAVRSGSDIPWDDDADICMTRADFEVFRREAAKELRPGFAYVEPDELGGVFFDFVPRVILLDSVIRKDSPREQYYGKGIYNHMQVDIFILDDVSDNLLLHKLSYGLLVMVYGMSMGRRYSLDLSEYSGASKAVIAVLSAAGKIIPVRTLIRWYEKISRMETGKNRKKHKCYYSNYIFADLNKIFDRRWFTKTAYVEIDGEKYPAPCGYRKILETMYGDYMTPPPEAERISPHCEPDYIRLDYTESQESRNV